MLTAALCSGRLSDSCAILRSCQQAPQLLLQRLLTAAQNGAAVAEPTGAQCRREHLGADSQRLSPLGEGLAGALQGLAQAGLPSVQLQEGMRQPELRLANEPKPVLVAGGATTPALRVHALRP